MDDSEGDHLFEERSRGTLLLDQLLDVETDNVVDEPAPAPTLFSGKVRQELDHIWIEHHSRTTFVFISHT